MWIQSKSSDVELPESDPANAKTILEKPRLGIYIFFDAILVLRASSKILSDKLHSNSCRGYIRIHPFRKFCSFFFPWE